MLSLFQNAPCSKTSVCFITNTTQCALVLALTKGAGATRTKRGDWTTSITNRIEFGKVDLVFIPRVVVVAVVVESLLTQSNKCYRLYPQMRGDYFLSHCRDACELNAGLSSLRDAIRLVLDRAAVAV